VILPKLSDFGVLPEVAIVAIFPNVAAAGIEERVVAPAIRELDTVVVSVRQGCLGLNEWFHYDHGKKQSDDRQDCLRVNVNTHVRISKYSANSRSYAGLHV
jgi:hypothetical protein